MNALFSAYMQEHGLQSVRELADRLGIQRTTIYDLIRPHQAGTYPSLGTLITLARAMNKPTHELLYAAVPDAPGAPPLPPLEDTRAQAREQLRALAVTLPDTDAFLRDRREDFGEDA